MFATFDVVLGGKIDVLLEIFHLEIHNGICDFANILIRMFAWRNP